MQINIDTSNLSALDINVLSLLAGADGTADQEAAPPAPQKQFTAADFEAVEGVGAVTAQRIVAALYGGSTPEADPEPEAEADPEPAAAEADPEPEAEDDSDAPTMSDAVAAATQLVSSGEAARVKAALAEVGAKRVSEMSEDDIPAFLAALGA